MLNRSGIIREFVTTRGQHCASCGLPRKSAGKLMEVPELRGQYCSILCAEQGIFEKGCRWCGTKADGRYCGPTCEHKGKTLGFGNGARLRDWLIRRGILAMPGSEKCLQCGSQIIKKQAGAMFCGEACKSHFHRLRANPEKASNAVSPNLYNQHLNEAHFSK